MYMKYIILIGFLVSPVVLLNYFVMPELAKLHDFYENIDSYAQQSAGTEDLQTAQR